MGVEVIVLYETTTPTLRATSPQGEASKAPIEVGCRQSRLRGGDRETEKGRRITATTPTLRATSPQGEASKAPIEGSCRQSRLRGGDRGTEKGRPMIAPPQNKTSFHKFKINNIEKSRIGNTNFGDYR